MGGEAERDKGRREGGSLDEEDSEGKGESRAVRLGSNTGLDWNPSSSTFNGSQTSESFLIPIF